MPMVMHAVQEEVPSPPGLPVRPIQEVLPEILETMMEEEMDMMRQRMTRLFIRMMQHDPLGNLLEILTPMVILIAIHECISL